MKTGSKPGPQPRKKPKRVSWGRCQDVKSRPKKKGEMDAMRFLSGKRLQGMLKVV